MKSVLLSTAVVAFGLSMSACSSVTNLVKSSTQTEFEYLQATVCGQDRPESPDFSDSWVSSEVVANGITRHYYADGYVCDAEYDYWATEEAQRSQEVDECSMTREQLIAFLKEYEFWGGSLDGMSPEEAADFMHAWC